MSILAGPLRVTTVLLLGLRKLRAEYSVRVGAWRELYVLHSLASPVAVDARSGDGSVVSGIVGARTGSVEAVVSDWAATANGSAIIAHMRARLLTTEAVRNRVCQECRLPLGNANQALQRAIRALAIPTRSGESVTWGDGFPDWVVVREFAQVQCRCTSGPALNSHSWVCVQCRRCRLPRDDHTQAGICGMCNGQSPHVCAACSQGVHFGNECMRWVHGADRRYRPGPAEHTLLCPECLSLLATAMQYRISSPQVGQYHNTLLAHMGTIGMAPSRGAGAMSAWPPLRHRAARSFVQSELEGRQWVRVQLLSSRLYDRHRRVHVVTPSARQGAAKSYCRSSGP